MGRVLRGGKKTEFDPSLLGRAGHRRGSSKKDSDGDGVDDNDDRAVTTRARSEAEQHQEDRRQQVRSKIPEAPPTPDKATLLLQQERGGGRATRGAKPTCIHFGLYEERCYRFPDHLFCEQCKRWEEEFLISDQKGRIKRSSLKYTCQADHTSWIHPTTLKSSKRHYLLDSDEFSDSDDEDDDELSSVADDELPDDDDNDDDDQAFSTSSDPHDGLLNTASPQQVVTTLQYPVTPAVSPDDNAINPAIRANGTVPKSQYDSLLKKYEQLLINHQQLLLDQECPEKRCLRAINPPSLRNDTENKKKKRISNFISILMDRNYFNGGTFEEILKQSFQFLRDKVYSEANILREMDSVGHKLSYEGIEVLRGVQKKNIDFRIQTILPSKSSISRCSKIVEQYGKTRAPYTLSNLPKELGGGEMASFEETDVIPIVLGASGMKEAATIRRIPCPCSADTTRVSKNIHLMLFGFKVNDRASICPLSKRPLFLSKTNNREEASLVQSYENCIPTCLVIAKETKEVVEYALGDKYRLMQKEDALDDNAQSIILGPGYKPIKSPAHGDMKMHWCGTGSGGATKVVKNPCHCCGVKDDDLCRENHEFCLRFCRQWLNDGKLDDLPGFQCFHRPMLTKERLQSIQEEAEDLRVLLEVAEGWVEGLRKESVLDCTTNPNISTPQAQVDTTTIHFNLRNARRCDKASYLRSLTKDLQLRELDIDGNAIELQERLHKSHIEEYKLSQLEDDLSHGKISETSAMYVILNAIPCSLHLENRVGLKIITRLLRIGVANAKDGKLTTCDATTENKRTRQYIELVEDILCNSVLGAPERPVSYQLPFDDTNKTIGTITLDNMKTRVVIANLFLLVQVSIPEVVAQEQWKTCIGHYNDAIEILGEKEDLSDDVINEFQWSIDQWYYYWFRINGGREGITNYIHQLVTGHIADYLFKWRNLYVHSQQGWENLNLQAKLFYFRRTTRGGGRGSKNRAEPLARWLLRRLVWMSGVSWEEIVAGAKAAAAASMATIEEL